MHNIMSPTHNGSCVDTQHSNVSPTHNGSCVTHKQIVAMEQRSSSAYNYSVILLQLR